MGIASLILGILSLLISFTWFADLSLILGVLALVLGIIAIVKKKGKGTGIAGVVLAVLALIMLFSSDTPETNTTLTSDTNSGTSTQTSQTNTQKEYGVGEVYQGNSLAIKFVSKNDNFKNYSKYADVKSGYKVIQASFEFENLSSEDEYVSNYDFNCYADGYDCESFYSVDDSSFGATLSTGKKAKGNVYFEVPKDATEITLEYELNAWTSEKVTFKVK